MPRIPPSTLDLVFYLYESRADAEIGAVNGGGTGFFVSFPSERFPKQIVYIYAVTNWHVARRGSSVIRVNTVSGESDIFEHEPHDWFCDGQHDIAVIPFKYRPGHHKLSLIDVNGFISEKSKENGYGCVGEDVFMVGRFIDHDGGQTNKPMVRFGHISTEPVPIKQETGYYANSYCIDLHSRSGFSGSPVFAYRTPGSNLEERLHQGDVMHAPILLAGTNFMALLGIHFAQFPELWELTNPETLAKKAEANSLITEGKYIKGMSGMTCVLPASVILNVLNISDLQKQRESGDERAFQYFSEHGFPAEVELPRIMS